MTTYLQMDGVDDYLKTPPLTFTRVEVDALFDSSKTGTYFFVDARAGIDGAYHYYNGTTVATGYNFSATGFAWNTRTNLIITVINTTTVTDDVNIFSDYANTRTAKGNIYGVKFYNGATLVAYYDMSTGTVLDQSGHGNHATLNGGTWVDDGVDTTLPLEVSALTETHTFNSIALSWTNPTDTDFDHIKILRDTVEIANNIKGVSYTDTNLVPSTLYSYNVKTVDVTGNESAGSSISATTDSQVSDDNTALTFVENITISGSPSTVPLNITIISIDHTKISDEIGINESRIVFTFDQDVTNWTVNVLGASYDTGTVADSGGSVSANTQITAIISWTELYQEGENRVNIYGQNAIGWTAYDSV